MNFGWPTNSSMETNFRQLIQNCDLPPPVKIFHGPNKGEMEETINCCKQEDQKSGLLKALRLSQTRAREAEKKGLRLAKEKEAVSDGLIREALRATAYRGWVRVLELQVLVLKSTLDRQDDDGDEEEEEVTKVMDWVFTLGIAGFGIGLAWRCMS